MKKILLSACLIYGCLAYAQPRIVDKAIIKMQTEIVFPDNWRGPGGAAGEGGGMSMMGGPGGMESATTIYFSGDKTKIESASDFGNNIVITDKNNKKTTTLIEAMGKKTGFYTTEEDNKAIMARMDSARDARRDSLQRLGISFAPPAKTEIEYTQETKKIAGIECKKAILRNKNQRGQISSTEIWYAPGFKMAEGFSFGGGSGMGGRGGMMSMIGVQGLDQIDGFPMEYSMERGNGMKMHMVVTKVQLDAKIEDKVFDVPKGYDLKPMSEMQRGGRMIFMGGGNN